MKKMLCLSVLVAAVLMSSSAFASENSWRCRQGWLFQGHPSGGKSQGREQLSGYQGPGCQQFPRPEGEAGR